MLAEDDPAMDTDVSSLMEMTHEAMLARWHQGLVTPMSSTISTFAKTDGSWWTIGPSAWQREPRAEHNERLDYHHSLFESACKAKGPVAATSPGRFPPMNR